MQMRKAFVHDGVATEIFPGQSFVSPITGQRYGAQWLLDADEEACDVVGLLDVVEANPPGQKQRIVSTELRAINGLPVEVHLLELVPIDERKAAMIRAVDAERDRRQQLDLVYDFGPTVAIDDDLNEQVAGPRALQMAFTPDQRNWQALQSTALAAVVAGQGDAILPMRAEDNWNVQTTATQVLQATAAMVARNAPILFYGGSLKSQVRGAPTHEALDAINIMVGWP